MASSWGPTPLGSALPSPDPDPGHLEAALDRVLIGHPRAKRGACLAGLARVPLWIEGPVGCGRSRLARVASQIFGPEVGGSAGAFVAAVGEGSLPPWASVVRHRAGHGEWLVPERERSESFVGPLDPVEGLDPRALAPWIDAIRSGRIDFVAAVSLLGEGSLTPGCCGLRRAFPARVRLHGIVQSDRARARGWARQILDAPGSPSRVAAELRPLVTGARARCASLELPKWLRAHVGERILRLGLREPELDLEHWSRSAFALLRAHAWLRGEIVVGAPDLEALDLVGWPSDDSARQKEGGWARAELAGALPTRPRLPPTPLTPGRQAGVPSGLLGLSARATDAAHVPHVVDCELAPARVVPSAAAPEPGGAIASLLARLERGWRRSDRVVDPRGLPRRLRPLRSLDELPDADPIELLEWVAGERAEWPRASERSRPRRGLPLVLLRDVSASMQGPTGRWCARLCAALVDLAERRQLPIGYVEFHHAADRFLWRGELIHRAHSAVRERARCERAEGRTSYQAALRALLEGVRSGERGDAVLVTDGVPVCGDPWVERECAWARERGWRVHTVFVGLGGVPVVLRRLAQETGAICARVRPRPGGAFELLEVAA